MEHCEAAIEQDVLNYNFGLPNQLESMDLTPSYRHTAYNDLRHLTHRTQAENFSMHDVNKSEEFFNKRNYRQRASK
jgi:hypothetical protein